MKNRLSAHLKITFYLCLLTIAAVAIYLKDAPAAGMLSTVYQLSTIGYFGTVLMIVSLLLLPTSLFTWSRWLLPVLGWVWLLYLVLDLTVFNLYRFHLDWLFVEMFFRDFSGMGIPVFLLVVAALLALVMLGMVGWLYLAPLKATPARLSVIIGLLLLMPAGFATNTVINIWATHYNRDEITQYRPYLPIYYPVEHDANAPAISQWWPTTFPAEHGRAEQRPGKSMGLARYPAQKPLCHPSKTPPSILMIVLESWQADSLRPHIMPNLSKFATGATRFDPHLSSGAATVPGLFGLMFGLHPNYFELFKASPDSYPSQFTETLHAQGYRSRVFTSSSLDGFALRSLFFPRIKDPDYVAGLPDHQLVSHFIDTLKSPAQDSPRFDFLFLTSSHASYDYPPDYARFTPLPAVEGGYALNRQADAAPYKNDYHNSLYYLDTLVQQVLAATEKQSSLSNTWVIITGDHAEEFNENGLGYWGHGSNFTRWQVQTPLLVKAPGQTTGAVQSRMSLHQDIVPTLMQEALGCTGPLTDYSNGANLFHLPEKRGTVMASYMSSAYLVDGIIMDRTVNKKYDWLDMKQERSIGEPGPVRELMQEERRFIVGPSKSPQ